MKSSPWKKCSPCKNFFKLRDTKNPSIHQPSHPSIHLPHIHPCTHPSTSPSVLPSIYPFTHVVTYQGKVGSQSLEPLLFILSSHPRQFHCSSAASSNTPTSFPPVTSSQEEDTGEQEAWEEHQLETEVKEREERRQTAGEGDGVLT